MCSNRSIKGFFLLLTIFLWAGTVFLFAGNVTFKVKSGNFTIDQAADGLDIIDMEGFFSTSSPGNPMLPYKVFQVAVPPDVDWSSLKIFVDRISTENLAGIYSIQPGKPDVTWTGTEYIYHWGDGKNITNGKNITIYNTDAYYPAKEARIEATSQMRKWKFVKVTYFPFLYNPAKGELALIKEADIKVFFLRTGDNPGAVVMNDTVMDSIAQKMFLNYNSALQWYGGDSTMDAAVTYDYVIITTNAIQTNSTKLSAFIAHKQTYGYSVKVVTETNFNGLSGQAPNHKAEKIRQWLKNNYVSMGVEYVLLIGNPSPYESGEGDIPMKMCWPRSSETTYRESPTDYFYADLTGNWNMDGDAYYGEFTGDYSGVTGGVDFTAEVYVGRIPVYGADYTSLDNILQKIINYETATNIAWRKSTLLPMSFSNSTYDGAPLAEQMMDDFLDPYSYTSYTQYQQGNGLCGPDSSYTSDEELRGGTVVRDRWAAQNPGIVCWWGHGWSQGAVVGYDGCNDGTLFSSSQTSSLSNTYPAVVFQNSCNNGWPEDTNNLGYALLKQGAINTVSASRVSWFNTGVGYGMFDGSTTNSGMGYEYIYRIANDDPAGDALYSAKGSMLPEMNTRLMNFYDFNLYGDPTTSIASQNQTHEITMPSTPTGSSIAITNNSTTYQSGGSVCSRGHTVEYQFYWGDGTYSGWAASVSRSHSWTTAGQYKVSVHARCSVDTSLITGWSGEKLVSVGTGGTQYTLTINVNAGGTTDPAPGATSYYTGTPVKVTAMPNANYNFSHWTGDVPARSQISSSHRMEPDAGQFDNPIVVTVNSAKTITANFSAAVWSTTKRLTWNSGASGFPAIAVDGNSNIHVIWQDLTPGNYELFYKKSTDSGSTWSALKRLTYTSGNSVNPKIAVDSNNNLHVVWSDQTPGNAEIYYKKGANCGATWAAPQRLTWNSGASEIPDVAVNSTNQVFAVWQDNSPGNSEIYFKKSTNNGLTWAGLKRITWNAGTSNRAAIAFDSNDKLYLGWSDTTPGNAEIHLKPSTNGGGTWLPVKRVTWNSGFSGIKDMLCDSSGSVHVFWNDNTPGNAEVYHRKSTDGGANWKTANRLTWNSGNSYAPLACVDGADNLHVLWDDGTPGNQEVYYKRSVNAGASWQALKRISWTSGYTNTAAIAADSNNNIHLVWRDPSSGNQEIYYKNQK